MYKLTAADFADTGQWRLLLKIGLDGLEALLENTLHPEIEAQILCRVNWEKDKENLCKNIEEAVYNNPRLLDDFATRIILYDSRTLLIPKEIAEATSGAEQELYKKVYEAEDRDIMTDDSEANLTAVWSPAPGVKSFLMRTFPGSRITCNLLEQVRRAEQKIVQSGDSSDRGRSNENIKESAKSIVETEGKLNELREGVFLYEDHREGEVDLILIKDGKLLSASTHEFESQKEIDNLVETLRKVYSV